MAVSKPDLETSQTTKYCGLGTPNERGWLWCQRLGFWLGTWEGIIDRETAIWLRFYDSEGNLVPLPEEAAQARAERLAARLRELGEDPDI